MATGAHRPTQHPQFPLHCRLALPIAVAVLAALAITFGGPPRAADAAGNCDPNPQFVDCLTPPLGVQTAVQGTTLTLSWTYDPAVFTERGRPVGLSIYNAGAFGARTAPALPQEKWDAARPRTSYPVPGLTPGEHAYYVCLNYHTLVTYTDGTTFDSYPELCPQFPAGGTVGGGSPSPAPRQAPRITKHEVDQASIKVWWSADRKYEFFNVSWIEQGSTNGPEQGVECDCANGYMHIQTAVKPGRTYGVIVKGCDENIFGDQSCSPWSAPFEIKMLVSPPTKPELGATALSERHIRLSWILRNDERIQVATVTRDGKLLSDKGVTAVDDTTVRPNTEYRYVLCLKNDAGEACSDPVTAMGTPVAPTAPADVRPSVLHTGGGAIGDGTIQGRPARKLSVTWRNTEVPGQFLTLEAQDVNASRGDGPATGPLKRWIEVNRLTAKEDPTSLLMEMPQSIVVANSELTTYRVCAVVPKLGDAGKVCSPAVSLP